MKVYIVDQYSYSNFDKEIEEIQNINPDLVLAIRTTEPYPEYVFRPLIQKIQPHLESNKNCKFKILTIWTPDSISAPNTTFISTSGNIVYAKWMYRVMNLHSKNYNPTHTTKLYTCYNRNPVIARAKLVDLLAKENLLQDGMVTFHEPDEKTIKKLWKYHDGTRLLDEPDFQYVIGPDSKYPSHTIPKSYCTGFLDIVSETEGRPNYDNECYFISEKTYKPLFVGKPFIALQSQGFHKKYLRDFYGLKLYDEVFDYNFDDETTVESRIEGIVENLKRLKILCATPEQRQTLYNLIQDKIEYNKSRILHLADDKNFVIPDVLRDIVSNNDVDIYGDINNIPLLGYIVGRGWSTNEKIHNRIGM